MNEINQINDNEIRQLLQLNPKPQIETAFANKIMLEIAQVNQQQIFIKRYKLFAWIFTFIAILFSVKVVDQFEVAILSLSVSLNSLLPSLTQIVIYITMLAIAGIILYTLNLLLVNRQSKQIPSAIELSQITL